jgi:hypothetical protein
MLHSRILPAPPLHGLYCRRYTEKTIGYAESHDQALVGDQTVGE